MTALGLGLRGRCWARHTTWATRGKVSGGDCLGKSRLAWGLAILNCLQRINWQRQKGPGRQKEKQERSVLELRKMRT